MKLRDYQQSIFNQIVASDCNDLVQLDTGAGKTPIIAKLAEHYGQALIVCHRNILIKQASEKLAANGLTHRIMASKQTKKICALNNAAQFGRHYINPRSHIVLISIDTWFSEYKSQRLNIDKSAPRVILIDEAHHYADENKWQTLQQEYDCRCIGFSATPLRGDGRPLLKKFDGFFDRIVQAEGYERNGTERLITEGYLSQYVAYYAASEKVAMLKQQIKKTKSTSTLWDYRVHQLQQAERADRDRYFFNAKMAEMNRFQRLDLISSAYKAYRDFAKGGKAIVVSPRISVAMEEARIFYNNNISAALIHSGIPQYEIERILDAYKRGDIRVLLAVDMISEGFDVPAADVLILARVVRSFGLYRQLCGRVLRPQPGKKAIILDLTGRTIAKHGLPSDHVNWSEIQVRPPRRRLRACRSCWGFFDPILTECPHCGAPNNMDGEEFSWERMLFTGKMVEAERARLAKEEQERLMHERLAQKQFEWNETYIDATPFFGHSMVSKRAEQLFSQFKKGLMRIATPRQYNEFMKQYQSALSSIDAYVDAIADEHKPEEFARRIYQQLAGTSL